MLYWKMNFFREKGLNGWRLMILFLEGKINMYQVYFKLDRRIQDVPPIQKSNCFLKLNLFSAILDGINFNILMEYVNCSCPTLSSVLLKCNFIISCNFTQQFKFKQENI